MAEEYSPSADEGILVAVDGVGGLETRRRLVVDLFGVEPTGDAADARRRVACGDLVVVVDPDARARGLLREVPSRHRHRVTFGVDLPVLDCPSVWVVRACRQHASERHLIAFVGFPPRSALSWGPERANRVLRPAPRRDSLVALGNGHADAIRTGVADWARRTDRGRSIVTGATWPDVTTLKDAATEHGAALHVIQHHRERLDGVASLIQA